MNQLTKQSTESEIKLYFEAILNLSESNDQHPVDIDSVWELVYSEKGKAVRALKKDFIENEDFIVIAQNGKNPQGGRPTDEIKLSISCLEYFIAKKVRPVFEVYRQVFHKSVKQIQHPTELSRMEILQIAIEAEKENQHLRQVVEVQEKKLETKSALESFGEHLSNEDIYVLTPTVIGARLGISANTLNKKLIELGVIKKAGNDYEMTAKYLKMKYGKRVVVKELEEKSIEALRWSRLGEAFIVNKLQGLDRTRYKTQIIPLTSTISVIN